MLKQSTSHNLCQADHQLKELAAYLALLLQRIWFRFSVHLSHNGEVDCVVGRRGEKLDG